MDSLGILEKDILAYLSAYNKIFIFYLVNGLFLIWETGW